jgi:hypothetical protein
MIAHHVDDPAWQNAIVTGFFTPDYEPLATSFSGNLKAHGVPHVLYDVPKSAWANAILLKPQIVARAMADYPGSTVILMDIDCLIRDSLAPMTEFNGDISLFVNVRFKKALGKKRTRLRVLPSSRIIAWKATAKSQDLLANWGALCEKYLPDVPNTDDEQILMMAIGKTEGLAVNVIETRYSALDPQYALPESVVIHHSAHNVALEKTFKHRFKKMKRRLISTLIGRPYPAPKFRVGDDGAAAADVPPSAPVASS